MPTQRKGTLRPRIAPCSQVTVARTRWLAVWAELPRRPRRRPADSTRLVTELDPEGRFGNDLVDGWLGLR